MREPNPPVWELGDLYGGIGDPRIEGTLADALQRAERFAETYRGKISDSSLSPGTLAQAIREYESILQDAEKPLEYASLLFAADTSDHERGALLQKVRERHSEVVVTLLFFELDLTAIPEDRMAALLGDSELDAHRHWVRSIRLFREHRLSEAEERILEEKANTGSRAFTRLFEETVSGISFRMMKDGREQVLTFPEIVALQRDRDRETRRAAAAAMTEGLLTRRRELTYVLNVLVQDKSTDDRLRRYAFPEQERHLANELDREVVEMVVSEVERHYALVGRYYRLKREILGLDKLTHYDRYAPLFDTKAEVLFERAREIVLDSFSAFSPGFGEIASRFFDEKWIDAEVRPGKRPGAFCSYATPDLHPYVLMSYTNRLDNVMTLGHEIGHGVHACLSGKQGYLSFMPTLPVAELASTFAQMLVFDALQKESDGADRLALYAETIEDSLATIFRQAAMFRFEQEVHALRRGEGELTTEEIGAVWQRRLQETFGESLELGDEHRFWWMAVSHFVSWPFYVYAYVFGQLLVMSLYAAYKREGEGFAPRYVRLLEVGGSMSPEEMLSEVGINIRDPEFWRAGIAVLEGFVDSFEDLYLRP